MLGVTQYISRQAVDALLEFAASLKAGSEIVFSFVPSDEDLQGHNVQIAADAAERSAAMGEPWKTRLRSRELVERLTQLRIQRSIPFDPGSSRSSAISPDVRTD